MLASNGRLISRKKKCALFGIVSLLFLLIAVAIIQNAGRRAEKLRLRAEAEAVAEQNAKWRTEEARQHAENVEAETRRAAAEEERPKLRRPYGGRKPKTRGNA
jgi:hypothetical protein